MRTVMLLCLFAVVANAAVLPESTYLPPKEKAVGNEYLPPSDEVAEVKEATEAPQESAALADDGYRYKTIRRLKYRQRRDVSEIANEYLPPSEEHSNTYVPPAGVKEAESTESPEEPAVLSDDGYHYKTVRRLKYRHRRDVSEIANDYLPPSEEPTNEYLPPAEVKEATEGPKESAVLADDGYHYKTARRLKYRHRRDVSEVIAPEYLPAAEVKEADIEVTEAPEESAALAEDGYRYKTVRRLRYRHRRDVSEIANDYLPPSEQPTNEYLPPPEVKEATESPKESALLADDGYHYKTARRLKYRHRRDVSEVIAPEYLPAAEVKEADIEVTEAPEESAALTEDGYQYKTVRRLKYRHRRDVSEIANDYLPPSEEPTNEYLPPAEVKEATEGPKESAVLADDGYHYKAARRLKYRHRRDVSEVIAPEYLPAAEVKEADIEVTEAPEESAALAEDGYRYKTVRRLRYRHRRDVSEIANDYLPPSEQPTNEYLPPAEVKEATEGPKESAVLADDGYHYKTARRLKYRHRRDVSEVIAPEYLPAAEVKEADIEVTEAPEESAALTEDGYQYKTVRRLKYRHRRDVSEIANDYLPPSEQPTNQYLPPAEAKEAIEGPKESAVLADDGYHYKTARRLKYRHRRDVSEVIAPEYLPAAEVKEADIEVTEAPEESAALAEDGYRYKTVRRLKYRHRRDVSEIANDYLPPSEEPTNEYLPPTEVKEATEGPKESAVLAEDGYRYKTAKRFRYRN